MYFFKDGLNTKQPFSYRGVDIWNSLKVEPHQAENKKRFKQL